MTTWSAFGIRCTFMSSARSRARWMSTFANVLWPPFRCLSAMQSGCSENFAPHAMTVATSLVDDQRPRPGRGASGWRTAPDGEANPERMFRNQKCGTRAKCLGGREHGTHPGCRGFWDD